MCVGQGTKKSRYSQRYLQLVCTSSDDCTRNSKIPFSRFVFRRFSHTKWPQQPSSRRHVDPSWSFRRCSWCATLVVYPTCTAFETSFMQPKDRSDCITNNRRGITSTSMPGNRSLRLDSAHSSRPKSTFLYTQFPLATRMRPENTNPHHALNLTGLKLFQ